MNNYQKRQLQGDRLVLSPFHEAYLTQEYVSWLNDPDVVKYSEQRHQKHTLSTCREYLRRMQTEGHFFWAILQRDQKNKHIGNLSAYWDKANNNANLALMIGNTHAHGQGFGKEAWKLACDFLLNIVKCRKVFAGTMLENKPMLSIMKASGMCQEACLKAHYYLDGKPTDVLMMALFPEVT